METKDIWERFEDLKPSLKSLSELLDENTLRENPVKLIHGLDSLSDPNFWVEFFDFDEYEFKGRTEAGRVFTWEKDRKSWLRYNPENNPLVTDERQNQDETV